MCIFNNCLTCYGCLVYLYLQLIRNYDLLSVTDLDGGSVLVEVTCGCITVISGLCTCCGYCAVVYLKGKSCFDDIVLVSCCINYAVAAFFKYILAVCKFKLEY